MTTTTELETTLNERKRAARELESKAERAAQLGKSVADMKDDLARFQKRQEAFAALGDGHVERAQSSYDERYHAMIAWEPIRSKLTGNELAAKVVVNLNHLRDEIAKAELEIEALLAE